MLSCFKKFWKAISTGWILEYPDSNNGPQDLFDRKDRRAQGVRGLKDDTELERCGWFRDEARGIH
jgi:hypothetical protein